MPEPDLSGDATRPPPERYGGTSARRRIALQLAVGAVAAALSGWLVWVGLDAATNSVNSQVLDFEVVNDRQVRATIEVTTDSRAPVTCTVRAQDAQHETTGVAYVTSLGDNSDRRVLNVVLKTRERAVAVTVAGCRQG